MALQLGQGGRIRSIDAIIGREVPAQTIYLGLYFGYAESNVFFPFSVTSTLADMADWEILNAASNSSGYSRQPVTSAFGTTMGMESVGLYGESAIDTSVEFNLTGALSRTIGTGTTARQINYAVLSTQASANTSNPEDVIALGPLLDPLGTYTPGDTLRINVGAMMIRQS